MRLLCIHNLRHLTVPVWASGTGWLASQVPTHVWAYAGASEQSAGARTAAAAAPGHPLILACATAEQVLARVVALVYAAAST